jgi:hypothetical protein
MSEKTYDNISNNNTSEENTSSNKKVATNP